MSDIPLHRQFRHFSELPYSQRVLYTGALIVLGVGYLFALINLFHTYAGKGTGNPYMMSAQDIVAAYSGTGKASRIESALRGAMSTMLPRDELNTIVDWVQAGASRQKYEPDIRVILEKRCLACHDGSNPHLPNLSGYDNVQKVTEMDTGTPVFTLVRVSHIHLFGMTFIFFIMGYMFSHAYVRPVWLKCAVIALPFCSILIDIFSWYITKVYHPFAYVVMAGGAFNGISFLIQWVVTMYQLWLSSPPAAVIERMGGDIPNVRFKGAAE